MSDLLVQQLLYYVNGIWRRRWLALAVAWFVCLAGWAVVANMPDTYQSSARIYVDTSSVLRPLLRGLTVDDNLANEVSFIQRTLTSRPNLEKVARMTDLDITAVTTSETEALLARLERNTSIRSQGTNLYHLSYQASDPKVARNVVQAYLTLFVESNLGQSRQDRDAAREFLEEQIQDYERQLTQAEERLARFKQENAGLLPGDRGYAATLARARDRANNAEEEYQQAVQRAEALKRQLNEIPQLIEMNAGGVGTGGPPSQREVAILELQDQIEKMLRQYTPEHPDVKIAQKRLDTLLQEREEELRAFAESASEQGVETGGDAVAGPGTTMQTPSKVYEQVKMALVETETSIPILKNQLERARSEVEALQSRAAQVPEVEAALTRLNRDYAVIKKNHDELLARREAARLSRARELKAEEIQFRIVEPPIVPTKPSGPPRAAYLIVTTVFGIGAGVAFAGMIFLLSGSIVGVAGLREQFGVPVLGMVSLVDSTGSRRLKYIKLGVFIVAGLALAATCPTLLFVEQHYGLANYAPRIPGVTRLL